MTYCALPCNHLSLPSPVSNGPNVAAPAARKAMIDFSLSSRWVSSLGSPAKGGTAERRLVEVQLLVMYPTTWH